MNSSIIFFIFEREREIEREREREREREVSVLGRMGVERAKHVIVPVQ